MGLLLFALVARQRWKLARNATELRLKPPALVSRFESLNFQDALCATRAAVEEGIVPGGGVALLRCVHKLENVETKNADEQIGVDVISRAIRYVFVFCKMKFDCYQPK